MGVYENLRGGPGSAWMPGARIGFVSFFFFFLWEADEGRAVLVWLEATEGGNT